MRTRLALQCRSNYREYFNILLYYIISYHIISYHIISYIISHHIISYHIISYIISYHIISYHIISYHIISYHIISYHIISYYIILLLYIAIERKLKRLEPPSWLFFFAFTGIFLGQNCSKYLTAYLFSNMKLLLEHRERKF